MIPLVSSPNYVLWTKDAGRKNGSREFEEEFLWRSNRKAKQLVICQGQGDNYPVCSTHCGNLTLSSYVGDLYSAGQFGSS